MECQRLVETFVGIGDRLKEERERLGLNQTDFAALAGASKNTQYNYEKGGRSPDANYLAAASAAGIDVLYVLTGERRPAAAESVSAEELELVMAYRTMSDPERSVLRRISGSLTGSDTTHKLSDTL